MCSSPPRSPTIVGRAVETIVWSSDASSITSIRPLITIATGGRAVAGDIYPPIPRLLSRARDSADPARAPGHRGEPAVAEAVAPADLALREPAAGARHAHRPVDDHRVAVLVERRRPQPHLGAGRRRRPVEA